MNHAALSTTLLGDIAPSFPGTGWPLPRSLHWVVGGVMFSAAVAAFGWRLSRNGRGRVATNLLVAAILTVTLAGALYSKARYKRRRRGRPYPSAPQAPLPVGDDADDGPSDSRESDP